MKTSEWRTELDQLFPVCHPGTGKWECFCPENKNSPDRLQVIQSSSAPLTLSNILTVSSDFQLPHFLPSFHTTTVIKNKNRQKNLESEFGSDWKCLFFLSLSEFKWATLNGKTCIHAGIFLKWISYESVIMGGAQGRASDLSLEGRWFNSPDLHVEVSRARYWTPNCSWWAGRHLAWQPPPSVNELVN